MNMQGRKIGDSTYVKWRETPVGSVFQGYVTRMETSVTFPTRPTIFIQLENGQEVGLPTTGRLIYCFRSANIVAGNFIRVTYKGEEKCLKGKYANGTSTNQLFDFEVYDELDRSSEPRYAAQKESMLSWYAQSRGGVQQGYAMQQQQGYGAPQGHAPQNIPQPGYGAPQGYAPQPPPPPAYVPPPAQPMQQQYVPPPPPAYVPPPPPAYAPQQQPQQQYVPPPPNRGFDI